MLLPPASNVQQRPTTTTMVMCAGCELPIYDRYLFHVLDKAWHATCITCADCKAPLTDKCFSRDGQIYCKDDFVKRFGTKCAGCDQFVDKNDLVRRARDKVFHVDCFCCSMCQKRLDTGEQLYILNGNRFICKQDYFNCKPNGNMASDECGTDDDDEEANVDEMTAIKTEVDLPLMGLTELSPNACSTPNRASTDSQCQESKGKSKTQDENSNSQSGTKRRGPRTTIKAKQLETLKAAFAATPKPTRHIREQLAQETGLNMRVIQVWFQNRRSKERRMKQLRYGGYRPGRRNRGALRGEDALVGPHMFQEGLAPRPGDPYYQPPLGYYCDLFGAPDGTPHGPPPEMAMTGPPPHGFMMGHDDTVQMEAHQPPDGHFILDDGGLRAPQTSPGMPLGSEEAFRAQHGFPPNSKPESVMPSGNW